MISPIKGSLAAVAADVRPYYYGHSGFKPGNGNVILIRLGPFKGRVNYKQEGLERLQTILKIVSERK